MVRQAGSQQVCPHHQMTLYVGRANHLPILRPLNRFRFLGSIVLILLEVAYFRGIWAYAAKLNVA